MKKHIEVVDGDQAEKATKSVLDEIVREGARRLLQHALELEVAEYVGKHALELGPGGAWWYGMGG